MLRIENLVYDINGDANKRIINNLSFLFPENKIVVITGKNGSGKSTLMKLLMGIEKPSAGKICYDQTDITDLSVSERAKLGFSMSFQQPVRFKGLTVKKMLEIATGKTSKISNMCDFLSMVGLCAKDYYNRELDGTLSGGEMKRIEIAMSIAKGGRVFLFDEPEAGIDLWSFDALVDIFRSIKNATIIIVSHQKKILEIADCVIVLDVSSEMSLITKKSEIKKFGSNMMCKKFEGTVR